MFGSFDPFRLKLEYYNLVSFKWVVVIHLDSVMIATNMIKRTGVSLTHLH